MMRTHVTQEEVKSYFEYHTRGYLVNRTTRGRARSGLRAGENSYVTGGYRSCMFKGHRYKVARLIYLWHHGELPHQVDHVDGDPSNDRIENLRAATQSQNQANTRKIRRSNTSGFRGVSYDERREKWGAKIQVQGKTMHLGRYKTAVEAACAYDAAARVAFDEFAQCNFKEEDL